MSDETKVQTQEADEQVPESTARPANGEGADPNPAEDLESDPAYNPDDPGLKGAKGG
jgi:hypothetical protein